MPIPPIMPDFASNPPAIQPTTDGIVVVGLDPGLGVTGYGALHATARRTRLIEAGVVRTNTKMAMPERLVQLFDEIETLLREVQPSVVAVEELYSHVQHPKTSIIMGHARGVLLLAAAKLGVAVQSYSATRVKQSLTGNGRAPKEQVGKSVQNALDLPKIPQPADVTDALAIALCHANTMFRRIPG